MRWSGRAAFLVSALLATLCVLIPSVDFHLSSENSWCRGPCILHPVEAGASSCSCGRLLTMLRSRSLVELVADKPSVIHLEAVRELHLKSGDMNGEFSTLMLALYARTFPGPSVSYLINHGVIKAGQVNNASIRSAIYVIAASDGLEQTRLNPGPYGSVDDQITAAEGYLAKAREGVPDDPYLHLMACNLAFQRFRLADERGEAKGAKQVYLAQARAQADSALILLPNAVALVRLAQPSTRATKKNSKSKEQKPGNDPSVLAVPCSSTIGLVASRLPGLPDSTAMPMQVAVNNALNLFSSSCAVDGTRCSLCSGTGCPYASTVQSLASLRAYGPTAPLLRFSLALTAAEHLALQCETHPTAFASAYALVQTAFRDLPKADRKRFVPYLKKDPFFTGNEAAQKIVLQRGA